MKQSGKTLAILFHLALLGGTSPIFALPDTGKLLKAEDSPAGRPLPAATDPRLVAALYSLRDSVYMNENAELIEDEAEGLVKTVESSSGASLEVIDRLLLASRAEFLAGRALNEAGLKEKAIARFEAAVELAKKSLVPGDHIPGLMALIRPLSELCLLKGMGFLLSNGPLVPRYTRQILDLDPRHRAATITLASSKAYPPGIFGGNPKEAISLLEKLLSEHPEGFEKDELFDLRACFGTAYAKLGDKAKAAFWFRAALEIYPGNRYARKELERLGG